MDQNTMINPNKLMFSQRKIKSAIITPRTTHNNVKGKWYKGFKQINNRVGLFPCEKKPVNYPPHGKYLWVVLEVSKNSPLFILE